MPKPTATTSGYLLAHYGPLLTPNHIRRTPPHDASGRTDGARAQTAPFAIALSNARRQFGRRVYFKATDVVDVNDQDPPSSDGAEHNRAKPLALRPVPIQSSSR
jgi:hypothetical protein